MAKRQPKQKEIEAEKTQPKRLHPLQVVAHIATIAAFLFGLYQAVASFSAKSVELSAQYDVMELPAGMTPLDYKKWDEFVNSAIELFGAKEIKQLAEGVRYGSTKYVIQITVENTGSISSKQMTASVAGVFWGVRAIQKGSTIDRSIFVSDNVEFGPLQPGDKATIYALSDNYSATRTAPRLLNDDRAVQVRAVKFLGNGDPLGIVPWLIDHPLLFGFLIFQIEMTIGIFVLMLTPFAAIRLWRLVFTS